MVMSPEIRVNLTPLQDRQHLASGSISNRGSTFYEAESKTFVLIITKTLGI